MIVGFILGIARKESIDHLRRQTNVIIDVNDLRELVGDDRSDLIDRLAWASEVRSGLDSHGADQREARERAYFGDLTQKEIADRLGVPIGTARGMRRLAERIEKCEVRRVTIVTRSCSPSWRENWAARRHSGWWCTCENVVSARRNCSRWPSPTGRYVAAPG